MLCCRLHAIVLRMLYWSRLSHPCPPHSRTRHRPPLQQGNSILARPKHCRNQERSTQKCTDSPHLERSSSSSCRQYASRLRMLPNSHLHRLHCGCWAVNPRESHTSFRHVSHRSKAKCQQSLQHVRHDLDPLCWKYLLRSLCQRSRHHTLSRVFHECRLASPRQNRLRNELAMVLRWAGTLPHRLPPPSVADQSHQRLR